MTRRMGIATIRHAATAMAGVCVLAGCEGGSSGGLVLSGCEVVREHPSGAWRGDPYELHPFLTTVRNDQYTSPACPVAILQPREEVYASGVVFSTQVFNPQTGQTNDTERAQLRMINSVGSVIREDVQPFIAPAGSINSKEIELIVEYPAISGHGTFTEKDAMQVTISDYCCMLPQLRGELELKVDYTKDAASARVTVVGDEIPLQNAQVTYGALSPSAGRPHTFYWYRDGVWAGSGSTYAAATGTADFDLRVDMSDGYGRTASGTLHVDVDGVRIASFDGPSAVWASEGGGTWTATSRGGSQPHTFNWYVDGEWVGSGESWSGYRPGREGAFVLRVEVANASGAASSASRDITQVGTGSGGCDPPPGELACVTP